MLDFSFIFSKHFIAKPGRFVPPKHHKITLTIKENEEPKTIHTMSLFQCNKLYLVHYVLRFRLIKCSMYIFVVRFVCVCFFIQCTNMVKCSDVCFDNVCIDEMKYNSILSVVWFKWCAKLNIIIHISLRDIKGWVNNTIVLHRGWHLI